jgi:potassium efflux system protein
MRKNAGILLLFLFLISLTPARAQQKPLIDTASIADTVVHGSYMERLKKLASGAAAKSGLKFKEDQIAIRQNHLLENISKTVAQSRAYLKSSIDTGQIIKKLAQINAWYAEISDGVFVNKGSAQTHRNLNTSYKLMKELLNKVKEEKTRLDKFESTILGFRNRIDSMVSDSSIYLFPSDSTKAISYAEKLLVVSSTIQPADSALEAALKSVSKSNTYVNLSYTTLNNSIEQIENYEEDLADKALYRQFSNLFDKATFNRPFSEIVHFSYFKNELLLRFYLENYAGKLWLMVILILIAWYFLRSLRKLALADPRIETRSEEKSVLRYPFLTALMLGLTTLQFIFPNPPFIFNYIIWTSSAICLTIIFRGFISREWMRGWLVLLFLFLATATDNLILQASRAERWVMFFLSISGVIAGSVLLYQARKNKPKESSILYFIGFLVFLEVVATICNLFGRYNLSKTALVAGYFNVIIGILFLWSIRLINEGLALASSLYKKPDKKTLYLNFRRVGERAPLIFYIGMVIGWIVLVGRNFYLFKLVTDPFADFLFGERVIGNYTFTISNVLLFFLITGIAVIVSRVISFFADDSHHGISPRKAGRSGGLGSWLLLIRISVITIGFFLAIAAAGIPLDRITIILGALSVGVGLGLQSLVNNLVSGLIIAFEKPVNVGDIIEVSGQSGTVKSINFRSSIIGTIEGADVIVPNGTLLNAQLINWTMNSSMRRSELMVGIAYDSDLVLVEKLLKDIMDKEPDILKNPPPLVFFSQFSASSIDVKILFWVSHFAETLSTKSKLITAINMAFKENGIVIPFPRHDIHIENSGT